MPAFDAGFDTGFNQDVEAESSLGTGYLSQVTVITNIVYKLLVPQNIPLLFEPEAFPVRPMFGLKFSREWRRS